jgi:hypothetical protein
MRRLGGTRLGATGAQSRRGEPTVYGAATFGDYTVQAWVDLAYPKRRIRIQAGGTLEAAAPAADELVVLQSYAPGFDRPR